jgi:Replication initiator protein A
MAATQPHPGESLTQPTPLFGRDEMNLADLPIALVADRIPKGQKTLYFEDRHGRLTVTGSDAYGLPTAVDTDVIVALIYLTKIQNNFTDAKVNFSRYELINLLNWPNEGGSYKRLDQSFNRWGGVWLVYDKCWWNNRLKCYTDAKMHIIESVEILDRDARKNVLSAGQAGLPFSSFTWNRTFIESCQADNLRKLDLDTYFSLKSSVSKRLYRYLGKRFDAKHEFICDLKEIAFERVGLSRNYRDAYKIKEKLQPAIEELEAIGFLEPLRPEDRYTRIDRGEWTIRLARRVPVLPVLPQTVVEQEPEPHRLVTELVSRGVTKETAEILVRQHGDEKVSIQIEVFDWLVEKKDKKVSRSPAGYLVKSITTGENGYAIPKGFVTRAERQQIKEAKEASERQAAEERRRQREQENTEKAEKEAIDAYWKSLDPEAQAKLDEAAQASANPERQAIFTGPLKKLGQSLNREAYIRTILQEQGKLPIGQ